MNYSHVFIFFIPIQLALAKKKFAYKFEFLRSRYGTWNKKTLLGTLSSISLSRTHHVNSPIKAPRQWCPSQLLLRIHFLKHHQPKTCNRLRTHYTIDLALYVGGVFMMKNKNPLILQSYINLTTACSQYQDKWICDETLYRLLNAHYPNLKNTFVFTREALNRVLSAKAGTCMAPNELSL